MSFKRKPPRTFVKFVKLHFLYDNMLINIVRPFHFALKQIGSHIITITKEN